MHLSVLGGGGGGGGREPLEMTLVALLMHT